MSRKRTENNGKEAPDKLPIGQVLLDDIFVLLALGLGIPFLLYTLWGVLEVLHVPYGQ